MYLNNFRSRNTNCVWLFQKSFREITYRQTRNHIVLRVFLYIMKWKNKSKRRHKQRKLYFACAFNNYISKILNINVNMYFVHWFMLVIYLQSSYFAPPEFLIRLIILNFGLVTQNEIGNLWHENKVIVTNLHIVNTLPEGCFFFYKLVDLIIYVSLQ